MLRFHKFKNEGKLQTLYSISATWLSTIRATVSQLQPYDSVRGDLWAKYAQIQLIFQGEMCPAT